MERILPTKQLMDDDSFDPLKLDIRIKGVVMRLRDAGFSTFASCQGGEHHAYNRPFVNIGVPHSEANNVRKFLKDNRLKRVEVLLRDSKYREWEGEYIKIVGEALLDLEFSNAT
jgi:hypothetical protein